MIPIPWFAGASVAVIVTLIAALIPAVIAWWNDRALLTKHDDPALPELLAHRRRVSIRALAIAIAIMIVWGGGNASWGIPLLIVFLIAAGYPLRTRILGETWGFGAYLWYTLLSILGGFGFWIALAWTPLIVQGISSAIGGGLTVGIIVAVLVAALMLAWEAWYPQLWLRTHAAQPLVSPELTPRFDEIVRRAGTVTPSVFRVGPAGSRFVNAVALPSVRRPSIAMGTALLELLEPDETAAIFAHEVAHFDQFTPRVVWRRQLINRVLILLGVALPLIGLLGTFATGAWVGWVWPILVLAALIRRTAKVQQHETESDLRAVALCGDPEALVRGLIKLHIHARIPRRYAVDVERAATHPSLVRRIQAIRAGGEAAVEQLGAATVVQSTRAGSWVVLDDTRAYWLDGVPAGVTPELSGLREAASSYRAVNYADLAELRVAAAGDERKLTARARGGDTWSVPLATEDVGRVQRALDVVDVRLGKAAAPTIGVPVKVVALAAFSALMIAGQAGITLVPIAIAMWKPSAASLAALGAMSLVRATLGLLEGTSWFDAQIGQIGLVALIVVGAFAIYAAWRLVRHGETKAYTRPTLIALAGLVAITVLAVIAQATKGQASLAGSPLLGTLGTALAGLGAALFTIKWRGSKPGGYAGLAAAVLVAGLGVDRSAMRLQNALTETPGRATLVSETDLGGTATGLRVSPSGTGFIAQRSTYARRPQLSLVAGKFGATPREIDASDGDFVDDNRIVAFEEIDSGIVVRQYTLEGDTAAAYADTLRDVYLQDAHLSIDHDAGSWSIVGRDDDELPVIVVGKVGESGSTKRVMLPDSMIVMGEPIVFGLGSPVFVPSYGDPRRLTAPSLWSMAMFGGPVMETEIWRVVGGTRAQVGRVKAPPSCGPPASGVVACSARHVKATSLYTLSSRGELTEVAQLKSQDLGNFTAGPGLRVASMSFSRAIIAVDLATKKLVRASLPPNTSYASDVRAGPGWAATLTYAENRQSTVRLYRIE
jgi:Zn-dependent protease with chaperone function